jgi:hypothetical protein
MKCKDVGEMHLEHHHQCIYQLLDNFEADGTVQNVNKEHSGRPLISTDNGSVETTLKALTQFLRKSVGQCSLLDWCL